jgi:hypothetical protein
MMQPCIDIAQKREKKDVFIGGDASHISTGFSVGGPIPFYDDDGILTFAQKAYDILRERIGQNHWLDQLARVDVMYNEIEDRLVINEVESLQACYAMKSTSGELHLDRKVDDFLANYYIDLFKVIVVEKVEARILSALHAEP